ncbi:hypothetical protein KMW28_14300 [Flammeovirga yaeyamensis]|uniref:Uncharacterized protein n=1 Tax=Flammeovirga yaeyamensis TaxID=367791 RepID=A0AAX1MZR8_9BACT|nr:hypothetical protein [Flammeovirga yaeyamensis]MBB3700242.1 hypothetical protein [Flammeovirga yaeyamensis]NMF37132.1 hypothetical protein [Flammeovirga yaeyamensis]QWG00823.1 hypothetical protein KMW28_14300 [Flammeovirga yaeyamensis]
MDFKQLQLRPAEIALLTRSNTIDGKILMRYTLIYLVFERVLDGVGGADVTKKKTILKVGKHFKGFMARNFEKCFLQYFYNNNNLQISTRDLLSKVESDITYKKFLKEFLKEEHQIKPYIRENLIDVLRSSITLNEKGILLVGDVISYLKERNHAYKYAMSVDKKMEVIKEMGSYAILLPSFDQEILPQFTSILHTKREWDGDADEDDFDIYFDEEPFYLGSLKILERSGGIDESGHTMDSQDDGGEGA